jgi:hypothetical protein
MCLIAEIFTRDELKGVSRENREALTEFGRYLALMALTSPAMREIIKKDRKIQRKLKPRLRRKLRQLKRKRK